MKKLFSVYCFCVSLLVIGCLYIIIADSIGVSTQGRHTLLPELGLAEYKVIPNLAINVPEANEYFQFIYQNGYNRSDFTHRFMSIVPSLSICNMLLIFILRKCKIKLSMTIQLFTIVAGFVSLLLAITLRIYMHGSYGDLETSFLYPFAYILFPC